MSRCVQACPCIRENECTVQSVKSLGVQQQIFANKANKWHYKILLVIFSWKSLWLPKLQDISMFILLICNNIYYLVLTICFNSTVINCPPLIIAGNIIVGYVPVCGEKEYYPACAYGELYAPPSAYFSLNGLAVQASFLGGTYLFKFNTYVFRQNFY